MESNTISVTKGEKLVQIKPTENIMKEAKIAVGKKNFIKHINRARLCLQACACIQWKCLAPMPWAVLGEELCFGTNLLFPCSSPFGSRGKGLHFHTREGWCRLCSLAQCFSPELHALLPSSQSRLQTGEGALSSRLFRAHVVKLQCEEGRGKVDARAKKYIQGSSCYASVQLQIVLCTERVTKDVDGWQGKSGVTLSLHCSNGENALCSMTPHAVRHMK